MYILMILSCNVFDINYKGHIIYCLYRQKEAKVIEKSRYMGENDKVRFIGQYTIDNVKQLDVSTHRRHKLCTLP